MSTDDCTCYCDCQTCDNYRAGHYDSRNPSCPIHGDES